MIRAGFAAAAMTVAILSAIMLAASAQGQTQTSPYPTMGPLQKYLMADRNAEIALARTAAPPAISLHATVLVLSPHGYQIADKGSNGFTCLVERSWMAPFTNREFWNWKNRSPTCYNPEASRSVLVYTYKRTDMVLAGLTKPQIIERVTAAFASNQLRSALPGSLAYMTSKDQYLGDAVKSWMPHLMFYPPKTEGADNGTRWGAGLPGSPVVFDRAQHLDPEPWTLFFVPLSHWSDGSPAPQM